MGNDICYSQTGRANQNPFIRMWMVRADGKAVPLSKCVVSTSTPITIIRDDLARLLQAVPCKRPSALNKLRAKRGGSDLDLTYAKVRFQAIDVDGLIIRWEGIVGVTDAKIDTIYLGVIGCLEFVNPKIRHHDRVVELDLDGDHFKGTIYPE